MTRTIVLAILLTAAVANADELLFPNANFESGTLAGWRVEGEAFQVQPTKGDNPAVRNRETSNHEGEYWIGGYENYTGTIGKPGAIRGDSLTGTLTSPEFKITKPFITFLIGGGDLPGQMGVKLICEGQEIELASGVDSETMVKQSSDVTKFLGKSARLVIFDNATGGWGHINVDAFTASDKAVPDTTKEFAFTDGISAVAYPDTGYDQPLRPQFHFSSRQNWLNDPNGMVFDGEKYHLFFQHNPKGTGWGNMTWGHATSPDMVHWTQRDHALLPYRIDRRAGTIFSGTAIVDHNNSLGKQVGDTKTLCAFFTFANKPTFYQAMAYSTDSGVSWTYWNEGRAVVPNQGFDSGERDPKVFWHETSQRWVMVLWVQKKPGRVRFFTSKNLTDWEFASDLMRDWAFECMDLVFLPVDGDRANTKCLIYDASFDYEIGTFDGQEFHSETEPLKMSRGNFYAAQTFNNAPQGRVVQIGWMRGGPNSAQAYDLPYNQQMSFPCELSLRTTPDGVRLFCWPVKEIESLTKRLHSMKDITLSGSTNALADVSELDLVDLTVEFEPGTASQVVFDLPGVSVWYDAIEQVLKHTGVDNEGQSHEYWTIDKLPPRDGVVKLRLLVDRLSLEAFAFDGETFGAHYINPKHGPQQHSIHAIGGEAKIRRLELRELNSAW